MNYHENVYKKRSIHYVRLLLLFISPVSWSNGHTISLAILLLPQCVLFSLFFPGNFLSQAELWSAYIYYNIYFIYFWGAGCSERSFV